MGPEVDLARSFVADTHERYGRHLVDLLVHALDKPKTPVNALDLACGVGAATLEVGKVLPATSRIVAISDDRKSLTHFHRTLPPELRSQVFIRKERAQRLPFALSSFDVAWACLPTRLLDQPRTVIRQGLRVLRPGAMLALCAPLDGSFLELIAAAGRELSLQQLIAQRPQLQTLDEWQETMRRAGGSEIGAERATFQLRATPPLSRDRLLALHLSPLWLGKTAASDAELGQLDRILDEPLTVSVHIGCVYARRGLAEIEEKSVT
jgi:SAM-dependent methyltransferase